MQATSREQLETCCRVPTYMRPSGKYIHNTLAILPEKAWRLISLKACGFRMDPYGSSYVFASRTHLGLG